MRRIPSVSQSLCFNKKIIHAVWAVTGLAAASGLTAGCRATGPAAEVGAEAGELADVTTRPAGSSLPRTAAEFFAPKTFYYVRVTGWDPSRLSPDDLRDDIATEGARLSVFRADPNSRTHCPDAAATDAERLLDTAAFTMEMSGNMTFGTPKAFYRMKLRGSDNRLLGLRTVNLKSMWNDVSQMRESLSWDFFKHAGVSASARHTYAKLCINGRYYGLYSFIEMVDKSFVAQHWPRQQKGNLYKAGMIPRDVGSATLERRQGADGDDSGRQYFRTTDLGERTYELKTNDDPEDAVFQTYDDLAILARTLAGTGLPGTGDARFRTREFEQSIEAIFDVKTFLRWAGANVLLGGWDNYWKNPNNYYLYNSGQSDNGDGFLQRPYFTWVPHDYDNSFGLAYDNILWHESDLVDWERGKGSAAQRPGRGNAALPALTNLLKNRKYLRYYLDHVEYLLGTWFNARMLEPRIYGPDGLARFLRESVILESSGTECPRNGNDRDDEQEIDQCRVHTFRQYTWFEVKHFGFGNNKLVRGNMTSEGLGFYIRLREASARRQLAALRARHPRGSSGVTFPDASPNRFN